MCTWVPVIAPSRARASSVTDSRGGGRRALCRAWASTPESAERLSLREVGVALAQLRRQLGEVAGARGHQALDDHVIRGDVGHAGEQAALRQIDLERPAQVQLLIESADQLDRLASQVHARADHAAQARVQRERAPSEFLGKLREVSLRLCGRVVGLADRERAAPVGERAGRGRVRIAARGLAQALDPAAADEARFAQQHHIGRRKLLERAIDGGGGRGHVHERDARTGMCTHRLQAPPLGRVILARGDHDANASPRVGSARLGQLVHAHRGPPADQPA